MVRMFKPQFAPLVESGAKTQTVRPTPKRMPKVGDPISLRMWTGLPYRSKQRVLREATITAVAYVDITESCVGVNSIAEPCDEFARADGFKNFHEMAEWFRAEHGLPFEGILIQWHCNWPDELNLNKVDRLQADLDRALAMAGKPASYATTPAPAMDRREMMFTNSGEEDAPKREHHESNAELTGRDTRAERFAEMDERDQRPEGA